MVVAIEEHLDTVPSQQQGILPHLFCIIIFPLTISVLGIKVVLFRGNEGRLKPLVQ
jgi:hypothetical protein